ncbi:MAG: FGGY-family carbohydrate kinase [Candidatus Binatia bacterium]
MDCFVTLDAGTGSGRCAVFDAHGRVLAKAHEALTYRVIVDPNLPMVRGFDLEPERFWGALARCARRAMAELPAGARVRGVIATSQREGCVFVDRVGAVLYAGPNLDARAAMEGLEAQAVLPTGRLHAITGHAPPYIFPLARYLWFRKHHDASRVAAILMLNDWITFLLSGVHVAEESNACESMLYDVTARAWSREVLEAFAIPSAILPRLCPAGTEVGRVTAAAASLTGIPEGTPVYAGGADTESALLGSGVFEVGVTGAVLGTTTPVQTVTDRAVLDPAGNLWTSCHVVADRWVLESNGGDTGGTYRWLLELLYGAADAEAHARAEAAVAVVDDGGRHVLTHLGPAIFNLAEMNPFQPAALLFRFPMLHTDRPTRGELLRGFFENVAFAIRGNCEQITRVNGGAVDQLWVSGGMTQSPTLLEVVAATLQTPLVVAEVPESASLGCAVLAAVGAGVHPDVASAVGAMVRTRTVLPDASRGPRLDERYHKWRELYRTLRGWSM